MPQITRATILAQSKAPRVRKVDTPEWADNGFVYVRQLRASEAQAIAKIGEASSNGKADEAQALATWCVLGICNRQGTRIFGDDDIPSLLDAPLAVLQRCALAVMELNGLTEEGESARKKSDGRSDAAVRVRSGKRTRLRKRR